MGPFNNNTTTPPGRGGPRALVLRLSAGPALLATLLLMLLLPAARAEPVQYCRRGDGVQTVDFCLGIATARNATTGAHDVYLTLAHTRPGRSAAAGWTAVGTGDAMAGALMFIVYGDPGAAGQRPLVSIRGAAGHTQPRLVTRGEMGGGDLRVLRADWVPAAPPPPPSPPPADGGPVTALVSLVCYSCTLWPGAGALSATATAQPWIWAWNAAQTFDVYAYDARLRMHAHHAGNGGWGRFYVDMARADSRSPGHLASVPVIRPGVAALGASESPPARGLLRAVGARALLGLHGALMALAFVVLFPAGVVVLRAGARRAFTCHWALQALASAAVAAGAAAGLALRREVDTAHQAVGLTVLAALGLQAVLGWRHHVDFVRLRRRTWVSHAHVWAGRAVLVAGAANLVLGLMLRGVARLHAGILAAVLALQLAALAIWVRRRARAVEAVARAARYDALGAHDHDESSFAIASPEEMELDDEELDLGEKK